MKQCEQVLGVLLLLQDTNWTLWRWLQIVNKLFWILPSEPVNRYSNVKILSCVFFLNHSRGHALWDPVNVHLMQQKAQSLSKWSNKSGPWLSSVLPSRFVLCELIQVKLCTAAHPGWLTGAEQWQECFISQAHSFNMFISQVFVGSCQRLIVQFI